MIETKPNKLLIFLFLCFCISFVVYIPIAVWEELQLFSNIQTAPAIIKESGLGPPLLFLIPTFIIFAYLLFRRLISKPPSQLEVTKGIKRIINSFLILFVSMLIYPLSVDHYLEEQGYSYCRDYSYAKIGAADIWLSNPSYCIDIGTYVRYDLVKWMLNEQAAGNQLSSERIEAKINELLAELPYSV